MNLNLKLTLKKSILILALFIIHAFFSPESMAYNYGFQFQTLCDGEIQIGWLNNLAGNRLYMAGISNSEVPQNEIDENLRQGSSGSRFWATGWAYFIYTLILLVILFFIRRYELNRSRYKMSYELEKLHTDKLSELDVEKSKFFSNISHEFRTPLTLILGPLDRLISNVKEEGQKQELMLVRRNARRLQTLINQLLSLSKIESGNITLKARPRNIVKLTRMFLQSFQSIAEDKGIKLEFVSDAEEHIVYIDTLKFEKVANNLLSNAFKFTEKGGKIKIGISAVNKSSGENPKSADEANPNGIYIKISDTGIGIRKEKVPHIFDRFYQVDEEQMKTYLGTGIGLSLTKELIELHRGSIIATSEPGIGTTFTIFIPFGKSHLDDSEVFESTSSNVMEEDDLHDDDYLFVQDVVTKSVLKPVSPVNDKLPLLLIVEDNDDMRAYIKSYLVDNYNIIEASNGQEGAEKAIQHVPDLIISDLMMPFMDGNEMTILLKNDERTSHIPIVLLTAKTSMESKLEGLETGADDFLTKPFDANELKIRIRNLIEQRKKLRLLLSKHLGDTVQTKIIKESSGKAMNKMDEQFLEKATEIVYEHMTDDNFSVEAFAKEMAMSRVQLHRKLKGLTDQSAGDFIRRLRLKKAAKLLLDGELNVTQVSYEVGMNNLSYFTKSFKEQFGVNPSEYNK